jgi:hypothetical protein
VDEAVAYAEVWRAVFEDARSARVRRPLARRTAWRTVAEAAGGVYADLPQTAEIAAVNVVRRGDARPGVSQSPEPNQATAGRALPPGNGGWQASSEPRLMADESLRSQVFALLDSKAKAGNTFNVRDGDDPYLQWMTARVLGVSVDAVARHVHDWYQQHANHRGHSDAMLQAG